MRNKSVPSEYQYSNSKNRTPSSVPQNGMELTLKTTVAILIEFQ
jgi:hypothetical protein